MGAYADQVFVCDVKQNIKNITSIVHLEAANIILAVRVWCNKWRNADVTVYCDNMAVVFDYCNSLLYGVSKYNVAKLQKPGSTTKLLFD